MKWRNVIIAGFAILFVILVLFPGIALSQGSVPTNGAFSTANAWATDGSYGQNVNYDAVEGHDSPGSVWMKDRKCFYSSMFVPSSGSTLSYWAKSQSGRSGSDWLRVYVINYDTSVVTLLQTVAPPSSWTQYSSTLSGYLSNTISLKVCGGFDDSAYWVGIDDVSVSSASNVTGHEAWLNGAFVGGSWGWGLPLYFEGYNGVATYGSNVGRSGSGGIELTYQSMDGRAYGRQFSVLSSSWSVWRRSRSDSNNNYAVYLLVYDGSTGLTNVAGDSVYRSDWTQISFSLSQYAGRTVSFAVHADNSYSDDLCPSSGCLSGTPTPTPSPTSTTSGFPYGYGTPVPIDWSQFPTQVPFPTFPPFPTQVPFPTSLYGLGTPQPITGSVTISGTVKIDDSTPVAVKIDDRTPVRVSIGPDPNYTPQVPGNWSGNVSSSAPKPGAGIPTLITSPSQSTIQYGQSGPSTNPINFNIAQVDWVTPCLNFAVLGAPCITLTIHYLYPDQFNLAGIDLLPGLYSLAAAFFLVFLLRQLQAR